MANTLAQSWAGLQEAVANLYDHVMPGHQDQAHEEIERIVAFVREIERKERKRS